MQKNKLNLHIYGIHLLNLYKTVVSHLNSELVIKIEIERWKVIMSCAVLNAQCKTSEHRVDLNNCLQKKGLIDGFMLRFMK